MDAAAIAAKMSSAVLGLRAEVLESSGPAMILVPAGSIKDVLRFLRDDLELRFNQLLDLTAVDYPKRNPRFDVVYILVSIRPDPADKPLRLIVKTRIADGESLPTVSDLWESANWGERECFDMFGIKFESHPNLKRILNPDNFYGYPLRKTFPLRGDRDPAFLEYKETEPA